MAKVIIPILHNTLLSETYRLVYDFLYTSYNKILRETYGIKALVLQLQRDHEAKLKASLTYRLLPYTMGGSKALENAFEMTALAETRKLKGTLVECGVA